MRSLSSGLRGVTQIWPAKPETLFGTSSSARSGLAVKLGWLVGTLRLTKNAVLPGTTEAASMSTGSPPLISLSIGNCTEPVVENPSSVFRPALSAWVRASSVGRIGTLTVASAVGLPMPMFESKRFDGNGIWPRPESKIANERLLMVKLHAITRSPSVRPLRSSTF